MSQITLHDALRRLENAKAAEAAAAQARLDAESVVLSLAGELPLEGTTRCVAGDLQAVIVTALRRSVDADKLAALAVEIPEAIGKRLLRWKPELVTAELRYIERNEPALYAIVAQAIEIKPSKPSVRVEPVKADAQREAA
jgi:hypothetical protein